MDIKCQSGDPEIGVMLLLCLCCFVSCFVFVLFALEFNISRLEFAKSSAQGSTCVL